MKKSMHLTCLLGAFAVCVLLCACLANSMAHADFPVTEPVSAITPELPVLPHTGETTPVSTHTHFFVDNEIIPPTCMTVGYRVQVCACGIQRVIMDTPATGHNYTEAVTHPTCVTEGCRTQVCDCGAVNVITIPALGHSYTEAIVTPTCVTEGYTVKTCAVCGDVQYTHYTPATDVHAWSDWTVVHPANPECTGIQCRQCTVCAKSEERSYAFQWSSDNAVYIPNTEINTSFVQSTFTEWAVNTYDIVFTRPRGLNDELCILGHNTRSMRTLYDTQIGQRVYIMLDGELRIYEVVVSEYAVCNATRTRMIGQTTGASLWDFVGNETLKLYTCYGNDRNGRWMVLAKRVA